MSGLYAKSAQQPIKQYENQGGADQPASKFPGAEAGKTGTKYTHDRFLFVDSAPARPVQLNAGNSRY